MLEIEKLAKAKVGPRKHLYLSIPSAILSRSSEKTCYPNKRYLKESTSSSLGAEHYHTKYTMKGDVQVSHSQCHTTDI